MMASSQEKIQNHVCIIEKTIETIRNKSLQSIINEYKEFLLEEVEINKVDKQSLKLDWYKEETIRHRPLANKSLTLEEEIERKEKELEELRDEIDNLVINSIAAKESFKIEQAEKEQHTKCFFADAENRLIEELENVNKECTKIEEELKNQISVEIAHKKARVQETRRNLQKQIVDRHSEYVTTQNGEREIRKKIGDLKRELANKKPKNDHRSNIIYFDK